MDPIWSLLGEQTHANHEGQEAWAQPWAPENGDLASSFLQFRAFWVSKRTRITNVAGAGRAVIQRNLDDGGRLLQRFAELCHRVVTHLVGEFLLKIESEWKSNRWSYLVAPATSLFFLARSGHEELACEGPKQQSDPGHGQHRT